MRTQHRIIRSSLSEQAAEKMKSWILSLQLRPGERLIVDNLADELEISRTPIREGLQKLVALGLVVYDGKSYSVAEFSRRDIENLFEIRCVLETLAARQASERMSDELVDELWKWYEEFRSQEVEKDIKQVLFYDMRYHQIIREGAENPRLKLMLDTLHDQIWWVIYQIYADKPTEYKSRFSLPEHLAILKCIAARDPEGAAKAMEKHLHRSEYDMLSDLK